ncbi:MAG: germination protein YpeB [Clostridia bacterium]|nr:germination protein YpeB [Clostridia bacterium]
MLKKISKKNLIVLGVTIIVISILLAISLYQKQKTFETATQNNYNMSFYEVVNHMQDVQNYLAKSLISKSSENGAETLTNVWREANLTQSYLSMLPLESQELENTQKFLNQVGDYSYSLSRKNMKKEELSDDDLNNLKQMHTYSVELSNTLNQLSEDLNSGRISWRDLTSKKEVPFAQQVSNISKESFSNLQESFREYSGLIYDGAFSEHLANGQKKAVTGDEISEDEAEARVREFLGNDKIKEIQRLGISENSNIQGYNFYVKDIDNHNINFAITKTGGHVISMNSDRSVEVETITQEEANEIGKEFLNQRGIPNMQETYYLKQEGIVTINYAYNQDGVIMYPDLIKVKVALDNGEILGMETTGYLNSHQQRDVSNIKIAKDKAKEKLNKTLEIQSEGLAVIPTEWQTEILCYEFKGKVDDTEFLVYINAENGNEEDILIITNTPNGTLTM